MIARLKPFASASLALLAGVFTACAGPEASEAPVEAVVLEGVPTFEGDATWPTVPADFNWGQVIGIYAEENGHVWTSGSSTIAADSQSMRERNELALMAGLRDSGSRADPGTGDRGAARPPRRRARSDRRSSRARAAARR